jgi:hypothetical protein
MDERVLLQNINPDEPTGTTEDGKPYWNVRCRVPFQFRGEALCRAGKAEAGEGNFTRAIEEGLTVIEGIASSTSVDFYGTEMALSALESMATQMKAGIPLLPQHGSMFDSMEWDSTIGETIDADIRSADVKEPGQSKGYVLYLRSLLYEDEVLSQALVRRLDRGQVIGQSIGGWFVEVQIIRDEDGNAEAIMVLDVELDHNAITRAPANPDATGIEVMRSEIAAALARPVVPIAVPDTAPETRSMSTDSDYSEGVGSLDRSAETAHDSEEREIPEPEEALDATISALEPESDLGPVEPYQPDEEYSMGDQTNQILEALETLQRSVTGLGDRIAAVEERATPEAVQPDPEPEPDPIDVRFARLESQLEKLVTQPNRRGRHVDASTPQPESKVARKSDAPTVLSVCERSNPLLEKAESMESVPRHQLERTLTDLFRAAELDGVISDPTTKPVQWGQ